MPRRAGRRRTGSRSRRSHQPSGNSVSGGLATWSTSIGPVPAQRCHRPYGADEAADHLDELPDDAGRRPRCGSGRRRHRRCAHGAAQPPVPRRDDRHVVSVRRRASAPRATRADRRGRPCSGRTGRLGSRGAREQGPLTDVDRDARRPGTSGRPPPAPRRPRRRTSRRSGTARRRCTRTKCCNWLASGSSADTYGATVSPVR